MTAEAAPDEVASLLDGLIEEFRLHHPHQEPEAIVRAYQVAADAHTGQLRQTGEPYITHPLIVARILAGYGLGADTLCAALLHDTVEDTELTIEDVRTGFGESVAELIDGVTKLDRIRFESREDHQAATIRKMVIAMARDVRVLLIKLADRLHNVRTIDPLPPEKQERIARETIEVYAPLAHRLGVQEIKHEMEERCFGILFPKRKSELEEQLRRRAPEREAHLEKVMIEVRAALDDAGVDAEVTGRPKHLYSVYRKMMNTGLEFEEIFDLVGIRIIVDEVRDCYHALGQIHTMWPPIQGRFKDYVAMPKPNLYQSLHTTVVGPDGKPLEVQIRTHEMHRMAEAGIAAHWAYKEGGAPEDMPLMADIRFLHEEYPDPGDFLTNLKLDLYQDEVFALTPRGDVITLPSQATPVDFAYRIHTDVGHKTVGAKVNGRLVPLDTELASGDIVEIITSRSADARPSRDWLEFVTSSRAAAKIRQWFSRERREQALGEGRDTVLKAVAREGFGLKAAARDELLTEVAAELGFADLDTMLVAVGEHNVSPATVVNRLHRLVAPEEEAPEEVEDLLAPPRGVRRRRPTRGISVEGWDDMLVRIARCCAPVPGDDIVGFVTVGRGVSVHRADCANIGALGDRAMERMVEVDWAPDTAGTFYVWLQVEALDRPKLLRDVTSVLSDLGANIHASSSATGRDRVAVLRYEVELSDPGMVDYAIAQLKGVDGVFDAYRLVQV